MPKYVTPERGAISFLDGLFEGVLENRKTRKAQAQEQALMKQRQDFEAGQAQSQRDFISGENRLNRESAEGISDRRTAEEARTARMNRLADILSGKDETFGDNEVEYERKSKIDTDKEIAVAQARAKADADNPDKKPDNMLFLNRHWPGASFEWKRDMDRKMRSGVSYDDAIAELGEPGPAAPSPDARRIWVEREVERLSKMDELPPGYDPLEPRGIQELAEVMVDHRLADPYRAAAKIQSEKLADTLGNIIGVDDITEPVLDPTLLEQAASQLGMPVKLKKEPHSLVEVATLSSLDNWNDELVARLLRQYSKALQGQAQGGVSGAFQRAVGPSPMAPQQRTAPQQRGPRR